MEKHDIEDQIRTIVSEITGLSPDKLSGTANFIDDLGIESVMAVDIVTAVETRFGIDIPVDRFGDIDSIDTMVQLVQDVREGAGA